MAKFNVGDNVKIIQRKKNNKTGTEPGWDEPNGNVGKVAYIERISKDNSYRLKKTRDSGYFGWFDEDDLELVSEEFVFPEKWCIRGCEELANYQRLTLKSEANCSLADTNLCYYNYTPNLDIKSWSFLSCLPVDYTEITFEQFKQHVLKKSLIVETPKEIDRKAIQEEAKKRFPIGCKFMNTYGEGPFTLKEENDTYRIIVGTNTIIIWAHNNTNYLYENGKWAELVSLPKEKQSIPEYVECVRGLNNATVGKIYKVIDASSCESNSPTQKYSWQTPDYIPSTKEAYEAQNAILAEYIPQVGDYVVMENAGGWGYSPHNNGCIAIVEKVSTRAVGYYSKSITVPSIGGQVINPKKLDGVVFTNVPIIGLNKERVFRKALPHEIPSDLPKKTVIEEWEPETYAVGVKGNFGIFSGSTHPISVGYIYTIKENRTKELIVEGKEFWIYKENLKWFATYEEALAFSKELKSKDIKIDSSEKVDTPSIKKETFIENVQSINVMLRTKKKSIKF